MTRILIVEDDEIVANIYRNKFVVEGFQARIALDGQAGLTQAHTFRPDAILLDLMLPRLSGLELMKRLRAEPAFTKLPVVVLSSTYLTQTIQDAWKAGATKCLSKANCTPNQVLEVVRKLVAIPGEAAPAPAAPAQPARAPAAPAAQPPPPAVPRAADAELQKLSRDFLSAVPATLAGLRGLLQALIKSANEAARIKQLDAMCQRVHGLTCKAGVAGLADIAQTADALEVLLKELQEKPQSVNASTLRTVAMAVDFLGFLSEHGARAAASATQPPMVLVVDDDAVARLAVIHALDKAKLKSTSVEDPTIALKLLAEKRFDLVVLDVDMPGMSGFELCARLRSVPGHKHTPVIFVTTFNDFESRAHSMMSGGNDFIAKPFLFMELALKSLVHVLRRRNQPAK